MHEESINVAEVIPYSDFKEKLRICKEEIEKGRFVEDWDGAIYTAERWTRC
ncbi:MAG TPA: hypothetical protein GX707_16680 [Epulopiscium sp.]|nr:hypothetical protein [Candidatus Epulonipiscium sp.]